MTRVIVILGFLLSFSAGYYTGTHKVHKQDLETNKTTSTRPYHRPQGGLLQSDLHLTPDQQTQMTQIWSDVSGPGQRAYSDKQRLARKEHDEAILAVLSPSTLEQIEKIDRKFLERIEEIDRDWRKSYEDAVEKTRKMLNPDQLARYNQILNARSGFDGRGGAGGRGGRDGGARRDGPGPSTRPGFGGAGGQYYRPGPILSIPTTRPAN